MTAACGPEALARLEAMARRLFPREVAVAAIDPRLDHAGLMPEEAPAIAAAVPKRRREFTAGRVAARRAMAEIGVFGRPVPSGPDRAPIWPAGVVGSISHTDTACIAVAARTEHVRSLGIDIEPDEPLDPVLWDSVCTREELLWLEAQPHVERGRLARLIFSAKECVYKCRYPLGRTHLDFESMRVEPSLAAATFRATFIGTAGSFRAEAALTVRFARGAGAVLTAMTLPNPAAAAAAKESRR